MAIRRTYIPNPKAADELLGGDGAVEYVSGIADALAERARGYTPVLTGESREAVVSGGGGVVDGTAVAYAGSESPIWHILEFGTVDTPIFAPFRRAAESLGLKWTDPGPGSGL